MIPSEIIGHRFLDLPYGLNDILKVVDAGIKDRRLNTRYSRLHTRHCLLDGAEAFRDVPQTLHEFPELVFFHALKDSLWRGRETKRSGCVDDGHGPGYM